MNVRGVALLSVCLISALPGAEPGLVRDGPYWVETVTRSEPLLADRLHIVARGSVALAGVPQKELTYTLKVRVKARSPEQAQRMVQAFSVRLSRQGGYCDLNVQRGEGTADLQVKVPRSMPEAVISTSEGALEIYDLEGSVTAGTAGGNIKADRIGGNLTARTAGGDVILGTVQGNAHCATAGGKITANLVGGEAVFETGGGDISAQEVGGLVRASTMAGSIRIRRAGSAVIASTGGGPIDVGQAHGIVTATNSGGPVQVGSAEGVRCETAAGGVHLDKISGSVRVTTAVGSIIASLLAGKSLADSFLSTGSGDITVIIPSNVGVTIRAQNELSDSIRRIVSDFPGIRVRLQDGQVVAEGPVNGGGPILRISGTGGTIFIKKQQ
jgi:DUF4097 and DUF4098 domain-containing protein YvlB